MRMNTAVVNVRVDPKVKKEAQEVASELGLTLSALISGFLKNLAKTKAAVFSTSEEPTEYLLETIRESEEDIREKRVISFKKSEEALKHLDKMIKDGKKRRKN